MDIVLLCFFTLMYIDLLFGLSIFDSYTRIYKSARLDLEDYTTIAKNAGWLLSPIYCMLISKVYFGLRAFLKRFAKGPYMSFYVVSWAVYGSGVT